MWAVISKRKADNIENTRPQGEQAQYMRQMQHKNLKAFARDSGPREQRSLGWAVWNVIACP
jgi:hypothetical protein